MTTVNVEKVLEKAGVSKKLGVQRAVQATGDKIMNAADPLAVANSIVVGLGGKAQEDFPTARIMAKTMVAEAVDSPVFVPEQAAKNATAKVAKLKETSKYLFEGANADATPKKRGRPATNGGDLKKKALEICEANKSLTNGEIAQMIQKQLDITYSNAYYYVSRVFKR